MNIIDYVLFNLTMEEINIYFARKFQKKTFEEIGKEFGVTRERIRQMEARVEDRVVLSYKPLVYKVTTHVTASLTLLYPSPCS